MAAIVTGLIPILRTAADATTSYKGRSLWFGFLCVRLVILFLAELPFTKLDADFTCNGTGGTICSRACFNRHFHRPMMMAWNFIFVLVMASVLLMELFTSHLRAMAQKRCSRGAAADVELGARAAAPDPACKSVLDLHKHRGAVGFYLLSIGLRVVAEAWFLYVLLLWNLPALSSSPYKCLTDVCPELLVCVVRAAPEKRMSIYALSSVSGAFIACSVFFCAYSIAHYLCVFKG